jgi:tetratricopeptide (TPR) repeat protein
MDSSDTSSLWTAFLIVAVGAFIYVYFRFYHRPQGGETSQALFYVALNNFADLAKKNIQIQLLAGETPSISMRRGERLLCIFANTKLLEPRAVRTWHSSYGGPTIRIAKGLSWRFGASRGVSESHDELRMIDTGTLCLTNERLVFIGATRTSTAALEKIIDIEAFADGLVIHREGKQKNQWYQMSRNLRMGYQYEGQKLAAPVDGRLIKLAIDQAIVLRQSPESSVLSGIAEGDAQLFQGNVEKALECYLSSLAIAERLAHAEPGDINRQSILWLTYDNIGNSLQAQGNFSEALKSYRKGLAIAEKLVHNDPGDMGLHRDLFTSYEHVGKVLRAQGKFEEALKCFRSAVKLAERLAQADPSDKNLQSSVCGGYAIIGVLLQAQGNFEDALTAYRHGLAIAQSLAGANDPDARHLQRDLYDRVGDALQAQHNFGEALKSYRQGLAIAESLVSANPADKGLQRALFVSSDHVGDALQALGNFEEALKSYRQGLAIAERLANADPGNTGLQRDLFVSCEHIGKVLKAQNNLEEALKFYLQGLAISKRTAQSADGTAQSKQDLEAAAAGVVVLSFRLLLVRDFSQALNLVEQAISAAPDLIWLYAARAHVLMFLGRAEEARSIYFRYQPQQKVRGEKSWEALLRQDFTELRKAGLTHPLMGEVENTFSVMPVHPGSGQLSNPT